MTMVITPRRHDKVLTHRSTNNRRIGDIESDSCFERDDDNKPKSGLQTSGAAPASNGNSNTTTPTGKPPQSASQAPFQFSNQQLRNRRQKKQNTTDAWKAFARGVLIMLALLVVLGSLLLLRTKEPFIISPPIARRSSSVSELPRFERFSLGAPSSCSAKLDAADVDYTLVTQVSTDRMWMMEHHCKRWRSENETTMYPMSIAAYTNDTTTQVKQQLRDLGCDMDMITVEILSATLFPWDDYPINILRNIALRGVKTSHVVYIDVDFWISQELTQVLQVEEVTDMLADDPKATLVLPAFMLLRQCKEWRECPEKNVPQMPYTLHDLKTKILDRDVARFDPTNRGGHGSTRYKDWFKQNKEDGDVLLEINCFLSNRYEPYLVFRYCKELPPFQEPFTGYGKNKMTWVMQLRREGYSFWQLGKGAFVIHYPHLDSPSRMAWNNAPEKRNDPAVQWQAYKRGQMDHLFVQFREWLRKEIPDLTNVPFCPDKLDDDSRLWYDRKSFNMSVVERPHH